MKDIEKTENNYLESAQNITTEEALATSKSNGETLLEKAKKGKNFSKELSSIPLLRGELPPSYKIGRPLVQQVVAITKEILSKRRNLKILQEEGKEVEVDKRRGEYSVTLKKGEAPIIKQVGKLEIYSAILSIAKKLSNDSAQAGGENKKNHSGLLNRNPQKEIKSWSDFFNFSSIIEITLKELTEFSGERSSQGREAMDSALHLISNSDLNSLSWKFAYLLQENKNSKKRKANEPITYVLLLNPIFSKVASNFGYLAQNAGERLNEVVNRSKTPEDLLLLLILSTQDKKELFRRDITTIVKELDIEEEYKAKRGRTEEKLYRLFQHRQEEGIVENFSFIGNNIEVKPPFEAINRPLKILASLNANYAKIPQPKTEEGGR